MLLIWFGLIAVAVILSCIAARAVVIAAIAAMVIAAVFAIENGIDTSSDLAGAGAVVPAALVVFPLSFVGAGILIALAYAAARLARQA